MAYYRLGEGSGPTVGDSSGNALNGTYSGGGVSYSQPGVLPADANTAVSFDGSSGLVSLPSGFSNFTNGFTYEGWIYPTTLGTSGQWHTLMELGNGPGNDTISLYYYSDGRLRLQEYQGTSSSGYIDAYSALDLNKWQYIVATIDNSGNAVIYKNGRRLASGSVGIPRNVTRSSNYLGKSNWMTGQPSSYPTWSGEMDEVAVYNKALSSGAILQHYDTAVATGTWLDRGNTSAGSYAIELQNADNVTLDHLNITDAYDGVHTTSTGVADASSYLTISNSVLFTNSNTGVNIDQYSDHATMGNDTLWGLPGGPTTSDDQPYGIYALGVNALITGSTAHDDSTTGIYSTGAASSLTGNTLYNNPTGLYVQGAGTAISANIAYANTTGINTYNPSSPAMTISGNTVYNNSQWGIVANQYVAATGNTVYGQTTSGYGGIELYNGASASQNVVSGNYYGIYEANNSGSLISQNRVFNNSYAGITSQNGLVRSNQVYSNATGIIAGNYYGGEVSNNLVYANTLSAMTLYAGTGGTMRDSTTPSTNPSATASASPPTPPTSRSKITSSRSTPATP